ncbi:MAG TPA: TonB-dependent receptor, partial [Tepidisphaeraceae bacterium]|nr:TonB-dependent receptor [Tepidisphaeraceae bacterium]
GLLVDSRVGSDASDLAVRYGGKIDDDTYYRIYVKGRADDDLQEAPTPVGEKSQWQDARTGFRIDHYSSQDDKFTLQGDGFNQSASDQLVNGQALANYTHDYRSGQNILARWTHTISDTSDFSLQAYYDRIDFRDGFSSFEGNSFDIDFQHRFELIKNNQVMYGMGARLLANDVGSPTLPQPVVNPTDREMYQLSAFVQDTITLRPDLLHLILGTKLEDASFAGFQVQPSARLLWTPNNNTSVWGAISRAVRTPSRQEWDDSLNLIVPNGPGQLAELHKISNHPRSEQLLAYEMGLRQQITKTLSVDATGFFNNYDGLISTRTTGVTIDPAATPPTIINQTYTNAQDAQTYGTEIAVDWQVEDNWKLSWSYSLLLAEVQDTKAGVTPNASAVAQSYPQNQFQLHSYVDITRHVEFNSSIYYVQDVGSRNVLGAVGAAPGSYWRADFGVAWHPDANFEFYIGVQNAFDNHHLEAPYNGPSSAEVDRAVYAQLTWKH